MHNLWGVFLGLLQVASPVLCFNIDVKSPIVYVDPNHFSRKPDRSTYFGYSVIMFEGKGNSESWVQIGAPRANSKQQSIFNKPGAVYRCPYQKPCDEFPVDIHVTKSSMHTMNSYRFTPVKDDAWIGVSMDIDSVSERVVVCGHRWKTKDQNNMIGACYWSRVNENETEALYPLTDSSRFIYDKKVYLYLIGQAGATVHLANVQGKPELIIGAPGIYNWAGEVVLIKDGYEIPHDAQKRYASIADFSVVTLPPPRTRHRMKAFDYFGYSITSGHIFHPNSTTYVTGAPRSDRLTGNVQLYVFNSKGEIDVLDICSGATVGEYFGAAVATVDLDNDGYDDLIVGSPHYSDKFYDQGRIYVYYGNSRKNLQRQFMIEGFGERDQFGTAIQSLGDINNDGFGDFVVSAPYEDNNHGVIYIYNGGERTKAFQYSQRIAGKTISMNLLGFGISFTKAVDIDFNKVNDFAVGSYLSGHVVLLRSYNVAKLDMSVVSETDLIFNNSTRLKINICSWYSARTPLKNMVVEISVSIDEEHNRILYDKTDAKFDLIPSYKNQACKQLNLKIKGNALYNSNPIEISSSQKFVSKTHDAVQVVWIRREKTGIDRFCHNCAVIDQQLSVFSKKLIIPFAHGCGSSRCISDVKLGCSFPGLSPVRSYVVGSRLQPELVLTLGNDGDPANYKLEIMVPDKVRLRNPPVECDADTAWWNKTVCQFPKPLNKEQISISLSLTMDEITKIQYHKEEIFFEVTVSTKNIDTNLENNKCRVNIFLEEDAQLTLQTYSLEDSYFFGNDMDIVKFEQLFEVQKTGISPLDDAILLVDIPVSILDQKQSLNFLMVYDPIGRQGDQVSKCEFDESFIIDAKSDEQETIINDDRSRRSLDEGDAKSLPPADRTLFLNCSSSLVACSKLKCQVGPFKSGVDSAKLQINMAINVSQLSPEYLQKKDIIYLTTFAFVMGEDESRYGCKFMQ